MVSLPVLSVGQMGGTGTLKAARTMNSYSDFTDMVNNASVNLSAISSRSTTGSVAAKAQALVNQTGGNILGFTYE